MNTPPIIRLRRLAWAPLRLRTSLEAARWMKAVQHTPAVQARLLQHLLADAAQTDFGRDFSLGRVRTLEDFRAALPIAGYERARPYVERVARGETHALFPRGTPIHMFCMTSGTTGSPKYLPITDALLKAFRRGWHLWGAHALRDHREAFGAKILQIASRMDEHITPCGKPAGAMSGLTAHMQRRVVKWLFVLPIEALYAGDTASKYYLACRLGLHDRWVMPVTANPSTLLNLARTMDERKEDLVRDLADGTLTRNVTLDGPHRSRVENRLKANPRRARELEAAIQTTGHLYPKDVWHLPLIGTWKGGTLSLYLREIPQYWGEAPIRDIGLIASETRVSIPLETEGSAGVLEPTGTFFEFVPEAEIDAENPTALLAHETEPGKKYFLILTTPGGLFRYNIHDLVEVVDRLGPAPVIRFLNKGEHVSNLTGEKLTEYQVTKATNDTVMRLSLPVRNYCLCPTWDTVPHYSLLVEEDEVSAESAGRLAAEVDRRLQALNMEYETKRKSGRLNAVHVKVLPQGTWRTYDTRAIEAQSGRAEQYKHKFLANDVEFERQFGVCACYGPSTTGRPGRSQTPSEDEGANT